MRASLVRRWLLAGSALLLLFGAPLIYQWYDFNTRFLLEGQNTTSVLLTLTPGMSTGAFARLLLDKKLIRSTRFFMILARIKQQSRHLQAGVYQVNVDDTPVKLLNKMSRGEVMRASVTLVEGWSIRQIIDTIDALPNIQHQLRSSAQINKHFANQRPSAEGLFYPDSYRYQFGSSDQDILQRAHDKLNQILNDVWRERDIALPYHEPYELLTAASVIEKETGKERERALISSVIVNRLRKGMRLQMDPTVIYGLGENYRGKLSRDDLRRDTPYNTYRRKGLPPTPIAAVGFKSLWAAAHPMKSQYLYFVAKGDGSHQFSTTLSAQRRAIKRYMVTG